MLSIIHFNSSRTFIKAEDFRRNKQNIFFYQNSILYSQYYSNEKMKPFQNVVGGTIPEEKPFMSCFLNLWNVWPGYNNLWTGPNQTVLSTTLCKANRKAGLLSTRMMIWTFFRTSNQPCIAKEWLNLSHQ